MLPLVSLARCSADPARPVALPQSDLSHRIAVGVRVGGTGADGRNRRVANNSSQPVRRSRQVGGMASRQSGEAFRAEERRGAHWG